MFRRRFVVGVATLSALLAGCGSEAAQEAAERSSNPVVAAGAKAADEGTARVAMSIEAGPQRITGEGAFDLAEGDEGSFTLTVPAPTPTTMEVRVIGDDVFMRVPGLEQQQPGKRWIRVDAKAAAGQATDALGAQNPVQFVQMIESAADFEEDGTTTVRGEEMARWSGTLDLTEMTEDRRAAKQLQDLGLEELPAEVAIDDDDRLRQVTFTMDVAAMAKAAGETLPADAPKEITFRIELFDFGAPVEVEAPPAAEVTDAPAPALVQQAA